MLRSHRKAHLVLWAILLPLIVVMAMLPLLWRAPLPVSDSLEPTPSAEVNR